MTGLRFSWWSAVVFLLAFTAGVIVNRSRHWCVRGVPGDGLLCSDPVGVAYWEQVKAGGVDGVSLGPGAIGGFVATVVPPGKVRAR